MPRLWLPTLALAFAACGYRGNPNQPPPPPQVQKIVVVPANPTVAVGATVQLSDTAYDANGRVVTGLTITWKSSAPAVASVDSNGLVSGVATGSAQISAAANNATGAQAVTVVPQ